MNKIKEILVGTNNDGKYKEICDLLPNKVTKHSPKKLNILTPKETGKVLRKIHLLKLHIFLKRQI